MGLIKMLNQHSYWETISGYIRVSSIFTCKRFETLMSSFHFIDNNSVTEETKKKLTGYGNCAHGFPVCEETSLTFFQKISMI